MRYINNLDELPQPLNSHMQTFLHELNPQLIVNVAAILTSDPNCNEQQNHWDVKAPCLVPGLLPDRILLDRKNWSSNHPAINVNIIMPLTSDPISLYVSPGSQRMWRLVLAYASIIGDDSHSYTPESPEMQFQIEQLMLKWHPNLLSVIIEASNRNKFAFDASTIHRGTAVAGDDTRDNSRIFFSASSTKYPPPPIPANEYEEGNPPTNLCINVFKKLKPYQNYVLCKTYMRSVSREKDLHIASQLATYGLKQLRCTYDEHPHSLINSVCSLFPQCDLLLLNRLENICLYSSKDLIHLKPLE